MGENPETDEYDAANRIIYLNNANEEHMTSMKKVFEWINKCRCDDVRVEDDIFKEIDDVQKRLIDQKGQDYRRLGETDFDSFMLEQSIDKAIHEQSRALRTNCG